jgi:hypothetical protein
VCQDSTAAAKDDIQGNKEQAIIAQTAMTQANLKYVMGQPMLTADQLYGAG